MSSLTCARCHRPLSNPASVQNGMGPICAGRHAAACRSSDLFSSQWRVVKVDAAAQMVWIIDLDCGRSVTNDADAVVAALEAEYPGYRIIYRDTMGNWDELEHAGARFVGYVPARHLDPTAVA